MHRLTRAISIVSRTGPMVKALQQVSNGERSQEKGRVNRPFSRNGTTMTLRAITLLLCAASVWAQSSADRIVGALLDRTFAQQVAGMKTDDRIGMYVVLAHKHEM